MLWVSVGIIFNGSIIALYRRRYQENIPMVNILKFQTLYSILYWLEFCFLCSCFFKMLSGMANNVDPDQTGPEGPV